MLFTFCRCTPLVGTSWVVSPSSFVVRQYHVFVSLQQPSRLGSTGYIIWMPYIERIVSPEEKCQNSKNEICEFYAAAKTARSFVFLQEKDVATNIAFRHEKPLVSFFFRE